MPAEEKLEYFEQPKISTQTSHAYLGDVEMLNHGATLSKKSSKTLELDSFSAFTHKSPKQRNNTNLFEVI